MMSCTMNLIILNTNFLTILGQGSEDTVYLLYKNYTEASSGMWEFLLKFRNFAQVFLVRITGYIYTWLLIHSKYGLFINVVQFLDENTIIEEEFHEWT